MHLAKQLLLTLMITSISINAAGFNFSREVNIVWSDLYLDKDIWKATIRISNNQNDSVIIQALARGKIAYLYWASEIFVPAHDSVEKKVNIGNYFSDLEAIKNDMATVEFQLYECNKLPDKSKKSICIQNWGGNTPSPWDALAEFKKAGTPISPTTTHIKYFKFNGANSRPIEISQQDFFK